MRIGIIGAGQVGGTLAQKFVEAGHEVAVANSRGPESLRGLEEQLGDRGRAVTAEQAAQTGDVLVISIPFGRIGQLPATGTEAKIVIDTTNYYPQRDGQIPELDQGRVSSSELLQRQLPRARVVKAFNSITWQHLRDNGRPADTSRYAIPYSGDDQRAKQEAASLIDQLGFDPVDAGTLAHGGRKHQPGTRVYIADLTAEQLQSELDLTVVAGDWTDAAAEARTSSDPRARDFAPRTPGE